MDYIIEKDYELHVVNDYGCQIFDLPFSKYMNQLLKPYLVNLQTRERMTKRRFGFGHKSPILVNEGILLLCIRSYRCQHAFYINYHEICFWKKDGQTVIIQFKNDHCLRLPSYRIFEEQLRKVKLIVDDCYRSNIF